MELKIGKVSERELVEEFGTPKQKEIFNTKGKLTKSYKNNMLSKVERVCKVKDMGNQTYYISKIYYEYMPKNFDKMNKDIYKYLIPIILNKLLVKPHLALTVGYWASELKMVNSNYKLCKGNVDETASIICNDPKYIFDFYDRADRQINQYITNAFKYLTQIGIIEWENKIYVTIDKSDIEGNWDKTISIKELYETREATDEEIEFNFKCQKYADTALDIDIVKDGKQDRYFGNKAEKWNEYYKEALYTRHIINFTKAYRVHSSGNKNVKKLLNLFEVQEEKKLKKLLTDYFIDNIMGNAMNRNKLDDILYSDKYMEAFTDLCDITINPETENIKYRINKARNYTIQIEEKANGIQQ